ncbi:MAG: metallophosphoesterase family protein [Gammaproteobacteria bacterium]
MQNIELIDSLDGGDHYRQEYIAGILHAHATSLVYGTEFVGRPETRIHPGEKDVVKIRAELDFDRRKAVRWVQTALQKERELAAHHPHKTWFLIAVEENDPAGSSVLIANICPRLQAIHTLLETSPETESDRSRNFQILNVVFEKYLTIAKRLNIKLDEGLSNFGVDIDGVVYYLDDEYYTWDNFVSFSIMLGCYIRTLTWLDCEFIERLAKALSGHVDTVFQDPHCRVIIAEQLRSLFMPNEEKQKLVQRLIETLTRFDKTASFGTRPSKNPVSRYIAVMADIHANYPALECVLSYLESENIQEGIILGDIVGYGPDPARCIERLMADSYTIIKGNHDHAVAINKADTGFSQSAKTVIHWTVDQLTAEHRDWLKYLPAVMENDEWLAVHGSPLDPAFFYGYVYLMTAEDNLDWLQDKKRPLCFHGHSHMPGAFVRDKGKTDYHLTDSQINFKSFKYSLACPGSVGQPRNGIPGAQFAVYDRQNREMTLLSRPYEMEGVINRMRREELPEHLWQRLIKGK